MGMDPQPSAALSGEVEEYFHLKSVAHQTTGKVRSDASKYAGRYLRYTLGGHFDVILHEEPPKFLKFFLRDGKCLATHNARQWGFVVPDFRADGGDPEERNVSDGEHVGNAVAVEQLAPLQMYENQGSGGFYWGKNGDDGQRVLKWRRRRPQSEGVDTADDDLDDQHWTGWVVKENPPEKFKGNPQLYWCTLPVGETMSQEFDLVDLVPEFVKNLI